MLPLDRVLIIAPHPDDETLATGGVIQRAGAVRVIFMTNGERNPWPQRVAYRKLRVNEGDRSRWGAIRRDEAIAALATLGAPDDCARFLGHPDTELMTMARDGNRDITDAIVNEAAEFAPTLVIAPSFFDLHADHRASSYFAHIALPAANIVTYVIHGDADPDRIAAKVELTAEERQRKSDAMERHATQLRLSRKRFIAHSRSDEVFLGAEHDVVSVETEDQERRAWRRHARHVLKRYV